MELIYATLLLHRAGKEINEENIKKVLDAVDAKVDEAKIKTLIASLKGVDIEKELESATLAVATPATVVEAKTEKKEEVKSEEAAEGLSSLFA